MKISWSLEVEETICEDIAMRSFVSEDGLAECQNFPLRLVFSRATTEGLERKTIHSIRKLVFLWTLDWKKACVFGMCISLQCNENVPLLLNSVWMGEAGDTCCEICFVGVWEQSSCTSLILWGSSRQLVNCTFSEVWIVSSSSSEHGRLGSLKVVVELCVFGPSLFGYNFPWFTCH
jgi:hypothetical protein